jgi:leucyl-tRNA synthetase
MKYEHKDIDKKWQDRWKESGIFEAQDNSKKDPYYILVEFPYPSGAGLHIGHPRSYTALDILARKRRMQGYNVLYPIGWDAFGLPTENFAIKHGRKPQEVTEENIATFKKQLQSLGISFDWSREINTTDPAYYKWTQWQFLQFFKADMAYKKKMPINWCLSCKIGLANEEVVQGACERCGGEVEKRDKEQWMIAITKYADQLVDDLKDLDYLPKIKKQQSDWIGRSEGASIVFSVQDSEFKIEVFTTRPDTIFGATYMVLAPEHELVEKLTTDEQKDAVEKYIKAAKAKTDIERGDATREKTGVFTGSYAINPANGKEIPVWIADYVLTGYGTGAIMAVPQHDERDREFAEVFNLPIVDEPLVDSDKVIKQVGGKKTINYKLRDWVFSRQRYWGEPIPLVHCDACDDWIAIPDDQLPVELPEVEKYEPTDSGESPLAVIDDWVNTTCPQCDGPAKRETDTMPNWAGSSWYFLRYIDPHNDSALADMEKLKYWMPVNWYNGGMEHVTLHLLYSRFWNKFLHEQGVVPTSEPYKKRTAHGLIMADDGRKMSKSLGNVVNPDDVVARHGADTLRVYEMFIGPFSEPVPWSEQGVIGVRRFLDRVMKLVEFVSETESEEVTRTLHQTIQKVAEDIEEMRFNTSVAKMMEFVNVVFEHKVITQDSLLTFVKVLCPFAPHIANEIAEGLGVSELIESMDWPEFDEKLAAESEIEIAVQVNGKLRGTVTAKPSASEDEVVSLAKDQENVTKFIKGDIKKTIFVPDKLVNFVV